MAAMLDGLWGAAVLIGSFLLVLGAVVFVHEFGHFFVARRCGVKVEVFSIGMGPELVGRTDRRGARWRLSAIPIGGYVRFAGDRDAASAPDEDALSAMSPAERRETLAGQPVLARAAIVAAGPIANLGDGGRRPFRRRLRLRRALSCRRASTPSSPAARPSRRASRPAT